MARCVCLLVRTRKMPPQPHPPCEKCRLAESARRSTIGRLRSGARPTQSGASRTAGSAYGGGISRPAHSVSAELREALRRRTAGYRARIRRKARNPTAPAQRGAWSEYLPSRRASAIAASCASRRLRLLRLVSPPPRLASRKVSTALSGGGALAPREGNAHTPRRERALPPGGRHSCPQEGGIHAPRVETHIPPGWRRSCPQVVFAHTQRAQELPDVMQYRTCHGLKAQGG